MATIDIGNGHSGQRALDHDIPLIPFIDFLLCLVAFLLVTAVWSQMARLNANAQAPGVHEGVDSTDKVRELHVESRGLNRFHLVWRENETVINSLEVEKKPVPIGTTNDFKYPDLAATVKSEWNANGQHRSNADQALDRAVLHVDNAAPFEEIAAIIDALQTPQRTITLAGKTFDSPAFSVAFAVN